MQWTKKARLRPPWALVEYMYSKTCNKFLSAKSKLRRRSRPVRVRRRAREARVQPIGARGWASGGGIQRRAPSSESSADRSPECRAQRTSQNHSLSQSRMAVRGTNAENSPKVSTVISVNSTARGRRASVERACARLIGGGVEVRERRKEQVVLHEVQHARHAHFDRVQWPPHEQLGHRVPRAPCRPACITHDKWGLCDVRTSICSSECAIQDMI